MFYRLDNKKKRKIKSTKMREKLKFKKQTLTNQISNDKTTNTKGGSKTQIVYFEQYIWIMCPQAK